MKIVITGDNGESIPPPYGGIMKRCLLHSREWIKNGEEVFLHVYHKHDKEDDLDSGVKRFYDFSSKPKSTHKLLFIIKSFLSFPILFSKLYLIQIRLYPKFDPAYFLYCASKGIVLEKNIKEIQPDIIVTETAGLQTLVAIEIAKRNNIPIVLENYAEIQYKAKDGDNKNTAGEYAKLWKYILENLDLVIPASKHCAVGPATYLSDNSKIHVVYSGISFDVFFGRMLSSQKNARVKFGLPQEKFLVMAVGALRMRKGHDHLFEALLTLPKDKRENMAVVLCGMGNIPELKERALEIGFPDSSLFIFQGLSEEDLAELYSSVDCFCFPSITPRECMGMAMKEAMAIGLPVVAYNTGGISEAIESGINGILVETGNKKLLAQAVMTMSRITDQEKIMYREKNAEKARRLFDIKKTSLELLQLLKNTVKNHER